MTMRWKNQEDLHPRDFPGLTDPWVISSPVVGFPGGGVGPGPGAGPTVSVRLYGAEWPGCPALSEADELTVCDYLYFIRAATSGEKYINHARCDEEFYHENIR
jgi:hypothetical protein